MGGKLPASIAVLLLGVALMPARAHACSCAIPPPPQDALAAADAVFEGTVTDLDGPATGADPLTVHFQVSRVWKGEIPRELTVFTAGNEAACGVSFQPQMAYLVYARADGKRLVASLCSRTSMLAAAEADLAALGPGMPPATGGGWATTPPSDGCSMGRRPASRTSLIGLALLALLALRRRGPRVLGRDHGGV